MGGGPLKAGNPTHNTRQNQRGWSNRKNTTKVEKGGSHKRWATRKWADPPLFFSYHTSFRHHQHPNQKEPSHFLARFFLFCFFIFLFFTSPVGGGTRGSIHTPHPIRHLIPMHIITPKFFFSVKNPNYNEAQKYKKVRVLYRVLVTSITLRGGLQMHRPQGYVANIFRGGNVNSKIIIFEKRKNRHNWTIWVRV